jgi:hypothetical protein
MLVSHPRLSTALLAFRVVLFNHCYCNLLLTMLHSFLLLLFLFPPLPVT